MTRLLRYWGDRLKEPRWSRRCQFIGLDRVKAILAGGRPIVLVTLHYGNLTELYHWIRACGIGVVFLANRASALPAYLSELALAADRANGLEGVPSLIGVDYLRLWQTLEILKQPNRILAVAAEGYGKRVLITQGPGYTLRVGPGALHIAAMAQAVMIPCLMSVEKNLKATIFFGAPLPDDLVADRDRHALAYENILEQLGPRITARPEQSAPLLIGAFGFNGGRYLQGDPRQPAS
jgi:lauroyl/myristoyl acyltransferase